MKWGFWQQRLGFWDNHLAAWQLVWWEFLEHFGFWVSKASNKAGDRCSLPSLPCTFLSSKSICVADLTPHRLLSRSKVWLSELVGPQPLPIYRVQHRRGCDLPSIHVCLSAIFCQAQTMQQNNPAKSAVHNNRPFWGGRLNCYWYALARWMQ